MIKELEAWVAVAIAAAAALMAALQRRLLTDEDNITGEVPPKVMSITLCFAGLPQEEIIRIFYNKFKPINLYRLRYMRGLRFDSMQDHNCVGIENGMLKLRKTSETYKDFGKSFYEMWGDAFYNYTTIFVSFFGKKALDLHVALAEFYSCIYELSTVYEWQEVVLPMAIEVHTFIVA